MSAMPRGQAVRTRPGRVTHYRRLYDDGAGGRAHEPAWLHALREEGMDAFEEQGFPLPRDEEWRFTPIGPIAEGLFTTPSEASVDVWELLARQQALPGATQVVVANGVIRTTGKPTAGLTVVRLRELPADLAPMASEALGKLTARGSALAALNTALMADALVIVVDRGVQVDAPVQVLYIGAADRTPAVHSTRALVLAQPMSSVTVIETYIGQEGAAYWTNGVTEVGVGDGAAVEHYRLQQEPRTAYHLGQTAVRMGRDSRYTSHVVQTGASLGRHDLSAALLGPGAECTLNGLCVANDRQLIDNHTTIDHAVPHCESHETYKSILADRARGVFNGKVYVREDAQKTNAKQSNQTLLLSEAAQIDTKPQLEIFADDVRCTHGATVGQLDAESLFYLRSRGIKQEDARAVLVHAFATDILDRMGIAEIRSRIDADLLVSLPTPSAPFTG